MGAELTPTKDRSKRIAVAFHKVGMRLRLPNVPRLTKAVHQRDRVAALAMGSMMRVLHSELTFFTSLLLGQVDLGLHKQMWIRERERESLSRGQENRGQSVSPRKEPASSSALPAALCIADRVGPNGPVAAAGGEAVAGRLSSTQQQECVDKPHGESACVDVDQGLEDSADAGFARGNDFPSFRETDMLAVMCASDFQADAASVPRLVLESGDVFDDDDASGSVLKEIDLRAHAGWHERKDRRLDRASVHSRVEDDEEMLAVRGQPGTVRGQPPSPHQGMTVPGPFCPGRDRTAVSATARPRERERAEERETVRAEVTELDMQVSICAPETTQTVDCLRRGGDSGGAEVADGDAQRERDQGQDVQEKSEFVLHRVELHQEGCDQESGEELVEQGQSEMVIELPEPDCVPLLPAASHASPHCLTEARCERRQDGLEADCDAVIASGALASPSVSSPNCLLRSLSSPPLPSRPERHASPPTNVHPLEAILSPLAQVFLGKVDQTRETREKSPLPMAGRIWNF